MTSPVRRSGRPVAEPLRRGGRAPAFTPGSTAWRSGRSERVAWAFFVAGVLCLLTLSAQGLLALGIPYDAPWGNYAAKLHPGTYLIGMAAAVALAGRGNPLAVAGAALRREPLLAAYLVGMAVVFVDSVLRHGPSGAAFIVDSLLMPAVAVLTLDLLQPHRRAACLWWLLLPLTANAVIGIVETLLKQRAIPFIIGGTYEAVEIAFRPSALMGHPLVNALATAALLPLPRYLRIGTVWQAVWIGLLWVALLSFGGRTSFLVTTAVFSVYGVVCGVRGALAGRWSYLQTVGGALAVLVLPTLLAGALLGSGVGDRIFQSLHWDSSAAVRARIWDIPGYMSDVDVWFGVSPHDIDGLIARVGLKSANEAVENFWLAMFLQLGIVGFLPFMLAIGIGIRWLWLRSSVPMRLATVAFFVSASGSNSLAAKNVCLTLLFVAVAATRPMPRPAAVWPSQSRLAPRRSVQQHQPDYEIAP